jgi:flagellum-specific ATP synthase
LLDDIEKLSEFRLFGRVAGVLGMLVEVAGLENDLAIGARCKMVSRRGRAVACEVVGFRDGRALMLPFGSLEGIGLVCRVEILGANPAVYPCERWLGRVINALGEAIDGKGPLPSGPMGYSLYADPPPAHRRRRVGGKLDLGVKAINTFLTCCDGQRMGIFAGSGVGKSILLSMFARYSTSDVNVIGLIGERGREVQEWLENDLGEEGLARSVVVVATSDEPPLMRRQAAHLTLTLAEFFRDQNKQVLCLMDSVTRFAMALREIGLAAGEPPTTKGYTPSVFSQLPRLLERAGPGESEASITGLFTVLVDGDDHNEPISDAVRGILDGHIVLDRRIAERNRYPAINVLRSISRTMPACNSERQTALVERARRLMADYEDMEELIRIGAYKNGSDPAIDEAIKYYPHLESFLAQRVDERVALSEGYARLAEAIEADWSCDTTTRSEAETEAAEAQVPIGAGANSPEEPNSAETKRNESGAEAQPADPDRSQPLRIRQIGEDSRRRMAEALNIDPAVLTAKPGSNRDE